MSEHTATSTGRGHDETVALRTGAFVALALGAIGALGGGILGSSLQWAVVRLLGGGTSYEELFTVVQGLIPAALGAAAIVMGTSSGRSGDAVAVPAGRTAVLLGVIAVVGGILLAVVGLMEG